MLNSLRISGNVRKRIPVPFIGKGERGINMVEDVELKCGCREESNEEIPIEAVLGGMNTHYLFGALNLIKAYIDKDNEKAIETINLLAKTIQRGIKVLKKGKAYTLLSDELEYVGLYLELAQIHYGKVEYTIINNSENFLIPIFTIRHMAEEAFIRCLTVKPEYRKLRIYTFSDSTHDYIEIKDSGEMLLKEEIEQLVTKETELKRNEYLLYKKAGWRVEIESLPDEGNRVFLSHPRKK